MTGCLYHSTVSQGLYQLENLENLTGPNTINGKVKYTIKDGDFGDNDLALLIYVDNMSPPIYFKVQLVYTTLSRRLNRLEVGFTNSENQ